MKRQSTRTGPPAQSGLESLQAAVVAALEAQAHPEWIEHGRLWHKNPDYAEYGVSAPMLGEIVRRFKPSFKQLSIAQRVHFAEALLASALSEQAHVAIVLLGMSTERLLPEYLEHLDRWPDDFHGWGATDDFCINVLQPLLVGHPGLVLPLLAQWSRSPNRWKRRASVVAFVRKIGASGRFTEDGLRFCEALVQDRDDLVRKGVGWALKDLMRGDKARVLAYVMDLRRRHVSATIALYAIRDLRGEERRAVLEAGSLQSDT